ncbi:MAG: thiamine pyrophosphate-binding protein [Rhodospirillales bacterium]|nr:thiamine pyrophosphate-binding protein [Rhodospirillales bacterium]
MTSANGHRKLLEQIHAEGVTYLFGNPGSSEEGLLDEISRFPELQYILGLQEAATICLADGYAQATQKPAIVQLHCSVGTGNAIGSIYHAWRRKTPMVVISGESGAEFDPLEAHMWVDLVGMTRPVTKYAARATHSSSLLRLFRRCYKIAATPPWGPVFMSIPQDVLDAANDEPVIPTTLLETRSAPDPALIADAAALLSGAEHPLIIIGDGVSHARAQGELVCLAETMGAPVWGSMASELMMPHSHPLDAGSMGHMFGTSSGRIVENADAVVICGTYVFSDVFPLVTNPFRADAKIVHVDLDTHAIAKNHPVTMGLVADPKLTLGQLAAALSACMTDAQKAAAKDRIAVAAKAKEEAHARAVEQDRARRDASPMYMAAFAEPLAAALPKDAIVFDEALTHSPELQRYWRPDEPGSFFYTPGGTLGVGIPGAVGLKLAHPQRTVVGFTGDGGAMYTYQALWTAAHYRIGAKFVVCNNRSYRLLKQNLVAYWHDRAVNPPNFPPPFDIHEPGIDYVAIAAGLGVPGVRVSTPDTVPGAIRAMLDHDGPFLIELTLEDGVPR